VYIPADFGSGLAGGRTQAEKDETWKKVQEIIKSECPTAIICSKEPISEKSSVEGVPGQNQGEKAMTDTRWIKN